MCVALQAVGVYLPAPHAQSYERLALLRHRCVRRWSLVLALVWIFSWMNEKLHEWTSEWMSNLITHGFYDHVVSYLFDQCHAIIRSKSRTIKLQVMVPIILVPINNRRAKKQKRYILCLCLCSIYFQLLWKMFETLMANNEVYMLLYNRLSPVFAEVTRSLNNVVPWNCLNF